MNLKKFLAVFLCAVMTFSTIGVMAADAAEVPTEYTMSEITGDALNITAVPAYIAIENPGNLESAETVEYALDLGLSFEAGETDEEAITKPYYSYVCDFELTFDHDVTALLAGQYDMFSDKWIAVNAAGDTEYELGGKTYGAHIDGVDFKANEPVRIMSFIDDKYTYREAIAIQRFNCGVKFAYDVPNGVKAKLELVMNPTIEVTEAEADFSMSINNELHHYKVDRDTKYVITSNEFTYNNNTHGITTDTTDAVKVENLNNDVENITTPEAAVGATHLIESLEQSAKDDIAPEVVIAIAQNTTGAVNGSFNGTVADVVYNLTPSTTVTVVNVTNTASEEPALADGAVVVEVTVTDDNNGGAELETVPAPIVVGIPVADASKVKKVLHLHDGVLEDVKFTAIDNVIYIQMSKFSQVAIIEDTAPTFSVTVNVSGSGSASANVAEAIEGEQIELTVTPDANYALSSLTVTDASGNAVAVTDNKFTMPASDVTVNAAFITTVSRPSTSVGGTGGSTTPAKITVKFETNGGSEIEDVKVEKGKTVEAPEAPVKENNIFIGWFADKDLTEEFDFDTEIKKATTIYAGWVEITAENSIVLVIDEKTATVFGEEIENDVAPLIVNERTMLPARFVAESLGANVEWDEETEKVTITKGEKVIEIFIGKTYAMVDGKEVDLDAPAFLENSRTYTPIRFISEELGAYVNWDDETKTVTITKIQ